MNDVTRTSNSLLAAARTAIVYLQADPPMVTSAIERLLEALPEGAAHEPSARHPMLDVLAITDAYESGMGQGLAKREFKNPYDPVNDPHSYRAYGHGYDEGYKRAGQPQPVSRNKDCLGDGVPCASDGAGGCVACDDGKGNYRPAQPQAAALDYCHCLQPVESSDSHLVCGNCGRPFERTSQPPSAMSEQRSVSPPPSRIGPTEPDDTMVICPVCTSQFRAIPLDVQRVRDELLAVAKRYAAECRLCGGHGTPLDDVSCEQCADVRLVIARAEGRSDE